MKVWLKKLRLTKASPPASDAAEAVDDVQQKSEMAPVRPLPSADQPAKVSDEQQRTKEPLPGKVAAAGGKSEPVFKSDHRSLYKQLLSGLYDAVLVTDPKGYIIDINARVTEFFQHTLEETWDMPVSDLVPGVSTALIARIQKGLAGERFVLLNGRCVRKDRTTFMAEIAISSINLMNDGDLVFCIRNVERRHAQMQRLKSCQNLLNHVVSASVACDEESNIKVVNTALCRLLGYAKPEDLVDKPFSVLWQEAGAPEVIRRVLEGAAVKETVQVVNRDGKRLQMTLTLAPELDTRKKTIGFLASFAPAAVVALGGASSKGK